MSAQIIDGRVVAAEIRAEIKGSKVSACKETGIGSISIELPADASEQDLLDEIDRLNRDIQVHGILVQLPLPHHMNKERVNERIDPIKDVDGFHPENVGKLSRELNCLMPCTPSGIPELIIRSGLSTSGKHAVLIGRSNVIGKPLMNILVRKGNKANCTVTCCHSGTDHLVNHTRQADILIAAIGVPKFVTSGMVKEGAIVIDVGINRIDDLEHSLDCQSNAYDSSAPVIIDWAASSAFILATNLS